MDVFLGGIARWDLSVIRKQETSDLRFGQSGSPIVKDYRNLFSLLIISYRR
jgi:hypothetical protein